MSNIQYPVTMQDLEPRLDELFNLLTDCHIKPYINEAHTNTEAVGQAEEEAQEFYVYAHSQAWDTFLETGELYLGHDVQDNELMHEIVSSIDGLDVEWDKTADSKIKITPSELSKEDYEWEILDDHQPEHNFFGQVMSANPDMSAQEISEELVKTMPGIKDATVH